jgi:hypothetical protein
MGEREIILGSLAGLVILILLIIVINSYQKRSLCNSLLTGLWVGDDTFCQDAGIDGMMLYIGTGEYSTHPAYLIMYTQEAVIMERKIALHLDDWLISPFLSSEVYLNCRLEDVSEMSPDITDFIAERFTIKLSIIRGQMDWVDDQDKMYAKLYRDNISSSIS